METCYVCRDACNQIHCNTPKPLLLLLLLLLMLPNRYLRNAISIQSAQLCCQRPRPSSPDAVSSPPPKSHALMLSQLRTELHRPPERPVAQAVSVIPWMTVLTEVDLPSLQLQSCSHLNISRFLFLYSLIDRDPMTFEYKLDPWRSICRKKWLLKVIVGLLPTCRQSD